MGRHQSVRRPWFARSIARIRLLDDIRSTGLDAREVDKPVAFEDGLQIQVYPHIRILPLHSLRIVFDPQDPKTPQVHARGPGCPAHRNSDGSLCLWYPKDSATRRWSPGDSGVALISIIVRHLRWEAMYRDTGTWPGFEAPHGYNSPGLDEKDNIIG
ncbi:hypothetical protein ABZX30_17640 [Streptomyces sp. NPDC004542]|uniref:hypothetical protein n=1 Tax=Streptomyces sp. NPDC004542 TaxID=3154281 RepID=UPI0033A1E1F5